MTVPRWVQTTRVLLEILLGLLLVVLDNLPNHEYAPGAAIGLGLLALSAAELALDRSQQAA